MPLAPDFRVTPHFTAHELGADKPTANDVIVANLTRTANGLEVVRGILGVPLVMGPNSGYRTAAQNAAVGGSPTSSHLTGEAGDFTPQGLTMFAAYRALDRARSLGLLGRFDQIIFYPLDGHIHYGIGSQMRGEFRIRDKEGYPLLSADKIDQLPGFVATAALFVLGGGLIPLLAIAGVFLLFIVAMK